MKKKHIFLKIITIFLVFVLVVYYFRSISIASNSNKIIAVSQENVAPENEFYLIMNLSAISYNKFQVEITNNQKLITEETIGAVSKMASNDVVTTFIIDKNINSLEKMGIVYSAPKNESMVNFNIKITSLDVTIETLEEDLNKLNNEIQEYENTLLELVSNIELEEDTTSDTYITALEKKKELEKIIEEKKTKKEELENKILTFIPETLTDSATINVVNNANNSSQNINFDKENIDSNKKDENDKKNDVMKERPQGEIDIMNDKMSSLEKSLKEANDTISSLNKGTTYQGSSNNYLSNISVDGYELDNEFNKTVNDYFINVATDTTKLSVTTQKEDSTATVTICGNTDLKDGKNKIIINVTAQDGSLRTYRIYVTK